MILYEQISKTFELRMQKNVHNTFFTTSEF